MESISRDPRGDAETRRISADVATLEPDQSAGTAPASRHAVFGDSLAKRWGRPLSDPALIKRLGSLNLTAMSVVTGHSYDHPETETRLVMLDSAERRTFPGWEHIASFVLDVATATSPQTAYAAKQLITACGGFVSWTYTVKHYPLNATLLFRREIIEDYITWKKAHGQLEDGGLRNYRSQLLRVSEYVNPDLYPYKLAPLERRISVPPYSHADIRTMRRWMTNQPSEGVRRKAAAMASLGMGAGLASREIGMVRTTDVIDYGPGIVVHIREGRVRDVPLLADWESTLRRLLEKLDGDVPVFGLPHEQNQKNRMSGFADKSKSSGFRPRVDRMRASWLVWHLTNRTRMRALMTAAGISKFENLIRYLEFVPELDTDEYRAELRGQVHS